MGTPTARNVAPAGSEYAETVRSNHCSSNTGTTKKMSCKVDYVHYSSDEAQSSQIELVGSLESGVSTLIGIILDLHSKFQGPSLTAVVNIIPKPVDDVRDQNGIVLLPEEVGLEGFRRIHFPYVPR
ncbi:hypothetical protein TNCV_3661991 [Trichonephila clavipes]|nr:hypothetical protein TNCV_3661991 [Trichonephila clavipes]